MNVTVMGASTDPNRYSYKAFHELTEHGFTVFGINPNQKTMDDQPIFAHLREVPLSIDLITLYINSKVSTEIANEILSSKPKVVIFNPGSENPALKKVLESQGVYCLEACTLVLLRTGQFLKAITP